VLGSTLAEEVSLTFPMPLDAVFALLADDARHQAVMGGTHAGV
jgi:hypothetical protein